MVVRIDRKTFREPKPRKSAFLLEDDTRVLTLQWIGDTCGSSEQGAKSIIFSIPVNKKPQDAPHPGVLS